MFRLHFDCCTAMPADVRAKIETLRSSSSSRGGRKQYWVDSAKRLGLVDTPHGIHFGRDPSGPLPPLEGPSAKAHGKKTRGGDDDSVTGDESSSHLGGDDSSSPSKGAGSLLSQEHSDEMKRQKEEAYPLVMPEDKPLISDYLFLTLEQMEPCKLMDADRVGCYKGRQMGFRGLACKWCVGQAGCGRYFPASEASLSQTTTSQTILNHVRNCRRCPADIRENLELMKTSKTGPDGKKFDKPKHGGRKVFFHRLWCRIQGVPIDEFENVESKIGRQKGAKNKYRVARKKKKRKRNSFDHHPSSSDSDDSDNDTETEDEEEEDDDEGVERQQREVSLLKKKKKRKSKSVRLSVEYDESDAESVIGDEDSNVVHDGSAPLMRMDDINWLSELQCFVRSDMVEFFSASKEDVELDDEDIVEGQVGVRCAYCAKLSADERMDGHAYFPESVSAIYQNVSDLQRRHFFRCNEMPDDARKSFKSLRGFATKAESETHQYWIDSARELGVANYSDRPGIKFYRNIQEPSAADIVVKERLKVRKNAAIDKTSLVRPTDISTDHAYLLMKQVRPCRFKNSDRRGGPGSRGRDRTVGFPGVACKHCSSKNHFGRYFPIASKTLADNTVNSIQSHLAVCQRCPESVKSSIVYLGHRASLQKTDLGSSWKKVFFKQVWDRLHVERAWTSKKSPKGSKETPVKPVPAIEEEKDSSAEEDNVHHEDDDSDNEDVDEMVKAAAQWLTKRDAQMEVAATKPRASRGRGLPSRKRRDE